MWVVAGGLLAVFLALNFLFDRPVRACVKALTERPLTTALIGLAVVVLAGPVTVLLAISMLGLVAVPVLWAALVVAALSGASRSPAGWARGCSRRHPRRAGVATRLRFSWDSSSSAWP